MPLSRNKLYFILTVSLAAGYLWLFINYSANNGTHIAGICLIKNITSIPCPSCGSTRSVLSILKGNFLESLYWNPLGLLLFTFLVIAPLWIGYDYVFKKETFFNFYKKKEETLRQKKAALPAILFVLLIWIWNIFKAY